MTKHKLITRQLKKYATENLAENEDFLRFVEAVNDSYEAFDKDKELSDHAFMISEQEFSRINVQLKEEFELKKLSIRKLKDTLNHITENKDVFNDTDDDILEIVDLLNEEITKRKIVEQQLLLAKEEAEKA